MSEYWVPLVDAGGNPGYAVREADVLVVVDVMCRDCGKRLQRFCCPAAGGAIGVKPFRKGGQDIAFRWRLRAGVPEWHMHCRCRHEALLDLERVRKLLLAVNRGELPAARVSM